MKPRIVRAIPSILIIGFWILMMGLLIAKEFFPENIPLQKIRFPKDLPYTRTWGIYVEEEKIGYLRNDLMKIKDFYINLPFGENEFKIPWFYISNLSVGDKFQWHILNPLTQKRDIVKAVVERASFYYNKTDFVPVLVIYVYYQDIKLEFWVDNEGNPLKVITPWGRLEAE